MLATRARHERRLVELLERELDATPVQARAIRALQRKLEGEIAGLDAALQAAARAVPPLPPAAWLPLAAAEAVEGWEEEWAALPAAEKRAVVRALIREIPVRIDRERTVGQGGRLTRTVGQPVFWGTDG
jgi:hypothetical protein